MSDATKQKKKTKISAREKQAVLEEMAMFKAFLRFCVESKQIRHLGECLNKNGEYEPEPQPSSRDDGFLDRCRFDSPEDAYMAWDRAIKMEKAK